MKKERNSDLRNALRSIIDERKPVTDDWQQSVFAAMDKDKLRLRRRRAGIAAAAAAAAVILAMAYFLRPVSPDNSITYSEVVRHDTPPEAEPVPTPEIITPKKPETTPPAKTLQKRKRQPEPEPMPEPIIIFDTDYLADKDITGPDTDLQPEEWIESLISSQLTNRYLTMISILDLEEEVSDTTDL